MRGGEGRGGVSFMSGDKTGASTAPSVSAYAGGGWQPELHCRCMCRDRGERGSTSSRPATGLITRPQPTIGAHNNNC